MPVCPRSPPPPPLAIAHLLSVSVDLSIGAVHISGVTRRGLCVWLRSLSTMFSRFVRVVACVRALYG